MLRLINRRLKWFPLVVLLMLIIGCGRSSSDSTMQSDQALDAMLESEAPENDLTADPSSNETTGGNTALSMVGYLGVGQNSLVNGLPNQGGENGASAFASLTLPTEPFSVNAYQQANLEARDACTRYVQGVAVEGASGIWQVLRWEFQLKLLMVVR